MLMLNVTFCNISVLYICMEQETTQDQVELKPLSHKKQVFCLRYISNGGNGSEAARYAGYAASRAKETASELLKDPAIMAYIAAFTSGIMKDEEMSAKETIREVSRMARAKITDIIRWDESGMIILKNSNDIDPAVASAIKSITVKESTEDITISGDTEHKTAVISYKVDMHSKSKALDQLMKYHDMNNGDKVVNVSINLDGRLARALSKGIMTAIESEQIEQEDK